MKKIILLSLLSFSMFSQTNTELDDITKGLNLLNNIRAFNELAPLKLNKNLTQIAINQAKKMANNTRVKINESIGESYYIQGVDFEIPVNYYNGILGLSLKEEWITQRAYRQIKCKTCTTVGFGKAKNATDNYVFIVFDSIK